MMLLSKRQPAPPCPGDAQPLLLWGFVGFVVLICAAPWLVLGQNGDRAASAPVPDLPALERAFQDVVKEVSPSVVGIRAKRHTRLGPSGPGGDANAGSVEQLVLLNGAGTIVRANGAILTNEHLIQAAEEIEVVLHDGRTLPATVVSADARSDLAILHIDDAHLRPARFCDWNQVARGQWNVALGNPYGLGNDGRMSVSVGVISNLGRRLPGLGEVDDRLYADMIQTTASIHPGNSGGPLFNVRGEMIGIVTAVHTRTTEDDGVGFAIALTPAKRRIIERLLAGERIEYGYLGVTVRMPELTERAAANLNSHNGVVVDQIEPGGPAERAGIHLHDVLTHFAGRSIDAPMDLAEAVGDTPIGQTVELRIRREKADVTLQATVVARQIDRVAWMRSGAVTWRGLRLIDVASAPPQHVQTHGAATGMVVIGVREGSPADRARLKIGDVIEAVNETAVNEGVAFLQAVRGLPGTVQLRVRERGRVDVSP